MSAIEINGLTRDYGEGKGVFGLSLGVEKGEAFGFIGPNGAGKTTVIRHLMGFIKAQSGDCKIGGLDAWACREQIQATLGYIPGELSIFDDMTGVDYLKFITEYRGLNAGRQKELTERFRLDPRGKLKKMSKGTKQKIGIVAAFMHDPDVLILDEPTSGLDPLMQSRFIDLIIEEKNRGKTIFISSHMFEEVERTCRRVGIIRAGRLVTVDSVDALKAAQKKKYILGFENAAAADGFLTERFKAERQSESSVSVTVQNNVRGLITALAKYPVTTLSAPASSLEEIFMQYYGEGGGNANGGANDINETCESGKNGAGGCGDGRGDNNGRGEVTDNNANGKNKNNVGGSKTGAPPQKTNGGDNNV
jgi:ABC-2 type transport system ATP-binding protein